MKSMHFTQKGFGHVAILFAVLFIAIVGLAGYKVMSMNKGQNDSAVTLSAKPATVPAAITSNADLVQTSKALDNTSGSVDTSLNDSALNADLNDML